MAKTNKSKAGPTPAPYRLDMERGGRVMFKKNFHLYPEAWERGERWKDSNPVEHTYTIHDNDRAPGAAK